MSEDVQGEAPIVRLVMYTRALGDHVALGKQLAGAAREELKELASVTTDLELYKECGDLVERFESFMKLWNKRSEKLNGRAW